jgi:hypothetical protein
VNRFDEICANCREPRGKHAAVTSGVNDEYWCPSPMGGFQEDHDHIGSHIFYPTGSYGPSRDWGGDDSWKDHPAVVALANGQRT